METSQFVAGEGVRDGDQEKADAYGDQDCVEHKNPGLERGICRAERIEARARVDAGYIKGIKKQDAAIADCARIGFANTLMARHTISDGLRPLL